MLHTTRLLIGLLLSVVFCSGSCFAWWDCGHHVIAVLAYNELTADQRQQLITILRQHPRFEEDFAVPEGNSDNDRWYIGQAGMWPDVARGLGSDWNRPTWHYELGSTLVIGQKKAVDVPERPGPLPADSTLASTNLYASQATALCRQILADPAKPAPDRALAISWLAHLVADVHQPCHAGSLYADKSFPEGDRGANGVKVRQERNLHAFWDSLLGRRYDRTFVNRKVAKINGNSRLMEQAQEAATDLNPVNWLRESREVAMRSVYTDEILNPIEAVERQLTSRLVTIDLSEDYRREAGRVAEARAAVAAYRLAAVWRLALEKSASATVAAADAARE